MTRLIESHATRPFDTGSAVDAAVKQAEQHEAHRVDTGAAVKLQARVLDVSRRLEITQRHRLNVDVCCMSY